ncbi:hypothetical protein BQ8794_180005 [Mesorhizobium prunaredense]|uniref:Uncharacterized protein n=1 Tax=Mesorhizobium prunaredense TaxID=1631249 RepID=A0A1R3V441_9HYPH|nr:hypothetical protein BQ8794_180005 [Mesorhizobium prunaredense]
MKLVQRWRDEGVQAGHAIKRIALAYEAAGGGFWLARFFRLVALGWSWIDDHLGRSAAGGVALLLRVAAVCLGKVEAAAMAMWSGARPRDAMDKETCVPRSRGRSLVVLFNTARPHSFARLPDPDSLCRGHHRNRLRRVSVKSRLPRMVPRHRSHYFCRQFTSPRSPPISRRGRRRRRMQGSRSASFAQSSGRWSPISITNPPRSSS